MNDNREFSLGSKDNSCDVIDDDGIAAAKACERISDQLQNEAICVIQGRRNRYDLYSYGCIG